MTHHSVALQEGDSRLWVTGGDGRGHPALDDQIIRRDPVLRLFIRDPELEIGLGVKTADDTIVRMQPHNKRSLLADRAENGRIQGTYESKRALVKACLPLHHQHSFTRAAFTDGACEHTRPGGGSDKRRTVSFGVWEGVFDDSYMEKWNDSGRWARLTASERLAKATARGMWGGKLPPDWQSIDAEMYAILAFLRKIYYESNNASSERVLVISD